MAIFGQTLGNVSTAHKADLLRRCGVLFQHGALFTALSVADNVAFPLRETAVLPVRHIDRLVARKLQQVGLAPHTASLLPAALSGGMIKRVGLARALALEPELLFLDEPTSGLDPVASEHFVGLIRQLRDDLGLTVVLVTHDLDTIRDLCDRIAVLADQRVVALGNLTDVSAVDHPFIHEYFHGTRGSRRVLDRSTD